MWVVGWDQVGKLGWVMETSEKENSHLDFLISCLGGISICAYFSCLHIFLSGLNLYVIAVLA